MLLCQTIHVATGNGLQFSVPVNDVAWHTLEIVVEGTFYSYTGRVRSTLQFKRSVGMFAHSIIIIIM